MNIKMLKAGTGDCFIITFTDGISSQMKHIMVDGGIARTYIKLRKYLCELPDDEYIDLLIITHADCDHVNGLIKYFSDPKIDKSKIKKVIFNSYGALSKHFKNEDNIKNQIPLISSELEAGFTECKFLEQIMKDSDIYCDEIYESLKSLSLGTAKITVLSPTICDLEHLFNKYETELLGDVNCVNKVTDYSISIKELQDRPHKEDTSLVNKASLAVLVEENNERILILGDSHCSVIVKSLEKLGYTKENKLCLDGMTLSHHGSKHNISYDLLELIQCNSFYVSTSSKVYPDKETIAKILKMNPNGVNLYYNYEHKIFSEDELSKFKITEYKI